MDYINEVNYIDEHKEQLFDLYYSDYYTKTNEYLLREKETNFANEQRKQGIYYLGLAIDNFRNDQPNDNVCRYLAEDRAAMGTPLKELHAYFFEFHTAILIFLKDAIDAGDLKRTHEDLLEFSRDLTSYIAFFFYAIFEAYQNYINELYFN
ncbi:hypothetical protein ACWOFR_02760 [Carnobacterium gallinarum]|uniref:hypothetical protein n=1 Tax=Carnobacterium gallinarum TaxID=2749 RepID=UPI000551E2DE|nr:hypothetical protein [Carnobacterium gallinarum]